MCISNSHYNNTSIPFLDRLYTNGIHSPESEIGIIGVIDQPFMREQVMSKEIIDKFKRNGKRTFREVCGKHESDRYRATLARWMDVNWDKMSPKELECATKYNAAISTCGCMSVNREFKDGTVQHIGSNTCKHKACPRCNANKAKKSRLRHLRFYEKNPDLKTDYDHMHLTLTAGHQSNGGKYQGCYAKEITKDFNLLRKSKEWKELVYAGSLSLEITKNANGLHVHIHALLLVRKGLQNRNRLHKAILLRWNKITTGSSKRSILSDEARESIKKGNRLITDSDVDEIDPSGATFIGLESIFLSSKSRKRGYRFCERSGLWKKYVKPTDGNAFMAAIMETIKYHFEPLALKKDGELDAELLVSILPDLERQPLHKKFGAFHSGTKNAHPDAKMLNVNSTKEEEDEDIKEILDDVGGDIINPTTGEIASRDDYKYFTTPLNNLFVNIENGNKIEVVRPDRKRYLCRSSSRTTLSALKYIIREGGLHTSLMKRKAQVLRDLGYSEYEIIESI